MTKRRALRKHIIIRHAMDDRGTGEEVSTRAVSRPMSAENCHERVEHLEETTSRWFEYSVVGIWTTK